MRHERFIVRRPCSLRSAIERRRSAMHLRVRTRRPLTLPALTNDAARSGLGPLDANPVTKKRSSDCRVEEDKGIAPEEPSRSLANKDAVPEDPRSGEPGGSHEPMAVKSVELSRVRMKSDTGLEGIADESVLWENAARAVERPYDIENVRRAIDGLPAELRSSLDGAGGAAGSEQAPNMPTAEIAQNLPKRDMVPPGHKMERGYVRYAWRVPEKAKRRDTTAGGPKQLTGGRDERQRAAARSVGMDSDLNSKFDEESGVTDAAADVGPWEVVIYRPRQHYKMVLERAIGCRSEEGTRPAELVRPIPAAIARRS